MTATIRVRDLSKRYRLGVTHSGTLREAVNGGLRKLFAQRSAAPVGTLAGANPLPPDVEEFWALRDLDFDVEPGEVLGVIGGNGAGKSTLLKILSRITPPTTGRVEIHGRVASLLEVGTGFHPELTGRENVFLNGAILGMSRAEIRGRFDEIVDFAEVEQFLDTPVKRYSSGMYVRLAFAVAAHLEAEVLIVDEVLAVGDAEFQRKCFNAIQRVQHSGRTILLVSHNMAAINTICQRALLLAHGQVRAHGEVRDVVQTYLSGTVASERGEGSASTEHFSIHAVQVESADGRLPQPRERMDIHIAFTPHVDVRDPGAYVGILTADGVRLAGIDLKDHQTLEPLAAGQRARLTLQVDRLPLLPGNYRLEVHLKDMHSHVIDVVPVSFPFEVAPTAVLGGRRLDHWFGSVGLELSGVECHAESREALST